jgi:hypothetical protein
VVSFGDARMSNVCRICGGPLPDIPDYYYEENLCRKHYDEWLAKKKKEEQRIEQRKAYRKAYRQRPEVKERIRVYHQSPKVPVMDCFEKDKPITFEELCKRSGGGRGWVLSILNIYQKLGLVIKVDENLFKLNSDSPLRMAVDGYFHEHEWDHVGGLGA